MGLSWLSALTLQPVCITVVSMSSGSPSAVKLESQEDRKYPQSKPHHQIQLLENGRKMFPGSGNLSGSGEIKAENTIVHLQFPYSSWRIWSHRRTAEVWSDARLALLQHYASPEILIIPYFPKQTRWDMRFTTWDVQVRSTALNDSIQSYSL